MTKIAAVFVSVSGTVGLAMQRQFDCSYDTVGQRDSYTQQQK
jgi:hypothetical protein